jgi:putative oxidoreductase
MASSCFSTKTTSPTSVQMPMFAAVCLSTEGRRQTPDCGNRLKAQQEMIERIEHITDRVVTVLEALNWLPSLLIRLFVGYFFFETGWAKIHNLDAFAQRFAGWGIPHPAFNAALSAYTECIGGALTVLGLATRLVSIPMIINMAVAILAVKLKNVAGLDDFVELDEPLYLLSFLWLMFFGAGRMSLDYLVTRMIGSDD